MMGRTRPATRVVSFNAHVGLGLLNMALRWVLRRNPGTTLVLVQEGRGAKKLHANLGRRFRTFPRAQHGTPKTGAMTYVAWLRVRYRFEQGWNYDISHGGQYPRRMTAALLWDRVLRRMVAVISVHSDPMGKGWQAPDVVVKAHQKQMSEYYSFIQSMQLKYPGILVVAGGDTNEVLSHDAPPEYRDLSAKVAFKKLGLKPAHLGKLDGIWISDGKVSGRAISLPFKEPDHPATTARSM